MNEPRVSYLAGRLALFEAVASVSEPGLDSPAYLQPPIVVAGVDVCCRSGQGAKSKVGESLGFSATLWAPNEVQSQHIHIRINGTGLSPPPPNGADFPTCFS